MPTFTVTATASGSTALGMEMALLVIAGQSASPIGGSAGNTGTSCSESVISQESGSLIVGTILSTSTPTPADSGTTFLESATGGGLFFTPFTAAGTGAAENVGGGTTSGISLVAQEILGSPSVSAQSLSGFSNTTAVASGSITPPAGSLLVALVATNGGAGVVTVAITDTSGLSLTWTQRIIQNGAGKGFTGVFTAVLPGSPAVGDDDVPWHIRSRI